MLKLMLSISQPLENRGALLEIIFLIQSIPSFKDSPGLPPLPPLIVIVVVVFVNVCEGDGMGSMTLKRLS
jgi:hypothetical protein